MSWLFSRALVEEYSAASCLDGEPSAPLSGNPIPQAYCAPDRMTDFSRLSRFGMMYAPLTESRGEELLTLYLAGFPARTSAQQDTAQASPAIDQDSGLKWQGLLGKYDPATRSWKTAQCSLLADLEQFLEIWPRWGLMRDGVSYQQQTLVRHTSENESGLLLPTPDTSNRDNKKVVFDKNATSQSGRSLATYARTFPTLATLDYKGANSFKTTTEKIFQGKRAHMGQLPNAIMMGEQTAIGGHLNPTWVEWLMGWPLGWTDLKRLETDKCQQWWQQHSDF